MSFALHAISQHNRTIRKIVGVTLGSAAFLASFGVNAQGMNVGGSFAVNPSGAATYTVPVQVPPGVSGMQPKLTLSYSSQRRTGLAGIGWSLDGLSAISRCPRTRAQDGVVGSISFDSNDRFCMDGSRLIVMAGSVYGAPSSEYRTEIDGFSQIKAYGVPGTGPTYFIVKTKSGLTLEFGNTADSRVEAQGKSTIRIWALNKVSDVTGNYIQIAYEKDTTGDYRPLRIDYTGTVVQGPVNWIQFQYEVKPDSPVQYVGGSMVKSAKRLTRIMAYASSNLVNDYQLAYVPTIQGQLSKSKLTTISQCDGAGNCLIPINVTWASATSAGVLQDAASSYLPPLPISMNPQDGSTVKLIDLNGDGLLDLVYTKSLGLMSSIGAPVTSRVWMNTGTGWLENSSYKFPISLADLDGTSGSCRIADVNGDGLPDLICNHTYSVWCGVDQSCTNTFTGAWLNTGIGWASAPNWVPPVDLFNTKVADINGDGLPDIITNPTGDVWLNTGTGWVISPNYASPVVFGPTVDYTYAGGGDFNTVPVPDSGARLVDLNGDGLPDIVIYRQSSGWFGSAGQAWLNTGSGWVSAPNYAPPAPIVLMFSIDGGTSFVDINGDGLPDFIQARQSAGVITKSTWLNTGSGWVLAPDYAMPVVFSVDTFGDNGVRFVDLNGDGLPDIIQSHKDGATTTQAAWLNNGSTWIPSSDYSLPSSAPLAETTVPDAGGRFEDIDGDGLADFIYARSNVSSAVVRLNKSPRDLVTAVSTNGSVYSNPGSTYAINYVSLVNGGAYTKDSGTAYPKVGLSLPLIVVNQVQSSNGVGGNNSTTYTYGGLKAELGTGRGVLGFRWMNAFDSVSGVSTYTEFSQSWPYVGMPVKSETRVLGSAAYGPPVSILLKRNTMALDCKIPKTATACTNAVGNTYFPYVSQATEESWDYDGSVMPVISTSTQYVGTVPQPPLWGDPLKIIITTSDGSTKTVDNTYLPADTVNWILGRVQRSTVTSYKP